jgi:hypothetical protein
MGSCAAAARLKYGPSIDPHQPMLTREWQTEYALMTALHDDINDLVEQRLRRALETGETVNVPDLASEITESLADLVVCGVPMQEQPRLIAYIVEQLGRFVTEKRAAGVGAQLQ